MLTRAGYAVLGGGVGLLTAGIATGNFFYATAALVPLAVLAAGLARDAPHGVRANVTLSRANPRAGDEVLCEVEYEAADGEGPLELHVALPGPFALATGSNVHVAVKRRGEKLRGRFAFSFVAATRGRHEVGPVVAEAVHPAGLRAPGTATVAAALPLDVRPREASVRRVRGLSGHAKDLFPENDQARSGIQTTEFRELRDYHFGDPIKNVNWKATARRAAAPGFSAPPLVNEYEREGKKAVWLLLDAAHYMSVGTTADDAFDAAVGAALGVASFYIARGYRLGAYVYNGDRAAPLVPDTGRRQLLTLTRLLTQLKPSRPLPAGEEEGLFAAVDRLKGWLVRDRPLIVVVTRVGKADERAYAAVRRLRALAGRRRRKLPVMIVSPVAASAMPAHEDYRRDVVALVRRRERPLADRFRRIGARVVEWDPKDRTLAGALLASAGGGR